VVEEAAEVLEAQLVAGLCPSLEHVVLIGDHAQLRPGVQCHALGVQNNLTVSLFERLALGGYPHATLQTQCRQHPVLARLIQPIYPGLQDHLKVRTDRPPVPGLAHRLTWMDHASREESHGNSLSNPMEARMAVELAARLVAEGTPAAQITILATYLGQMRLIRHDPVLPLGVQVHTVDGYQGDENEVVLVSLVRNNPGGDVGFLRARSRSCVLLSRARRALVLFGSRGLMRRSGGRYWGQVLEAFGGDEAAFLDAAALGLGGAERC